MSIPYLKSVKELYDHRSPRYDNSHHPKFARYMLSRALESPSPFSETPLYLDLACGTGLVSIPALDLAPPSTQIYGIDLSSGMLDVACQKISSLPSKQQARIRYIRHDMTYLSNVPELQGMEGKFDVITCASAFVLLSDPRKAIAEWARWLRPGGRLIVDATHPYNLRPGVFMEVVARKLGVQLPYDRSWATGEQAFRDVVESGGFFEIQDVRIVEQTGEGTKYYDSGEVEAVKQFEKLANLKAYEALSASDELRQKARDLFVREWVTGANANGKVEDVDGVYVIVARRRY